MSEKASCDFQIHADKSKVRAGVRDFESFVTVDIDIDEIRVCMYCRDMEQAKNIGWDIYRKAQEMTPAPEPEKGNQTQCPSSQFNVVPQSTEQS